MYGVKTMIWNIKLFKWGLDVCLDLRALAMNACAYPISHLFPQSVPHKFGAYEFLGSAD